MAYKSKNGRRPDEYASKSSHSHVINDPSVQSFLSQCKFPSYAENVDFSEEQQVKYNPLVSNPVRFVIAVDGGFTEVPVRTEFPSATVCFFQIGALIFSIEDLENLDEAPFIDPEDMATLNNIQRLKFTLPLRNIILNDEASLTHSVRRAIYSFFCSKIDNESLIDTLCWLIFEEFHTPILEWMLATCPYCEQSNIPLIRSSMSSSYTFTCNACGEEIFLTDVFRLHEIIDDELGAEGILGYVTTTVEQIVIAHLIHLILKTKPSLLNEILFVKDGPLAFFGQTANIHKPMRALVSHLFNKHTLYLVGLEKSGSFVEHADEIYRVFELGNILILDNDYIYKYILPGKADPTNPYGRTTYYSNKLIFKTLHGAMYVASLPTKEVLSHPKESDFENLQVILANLEKLKCDMYDNALVPIALANKLVSLSNHPSSKILQKFAMGTISSNK